jgi:hypothetical protein
LYIFHENVYKICVFKFEQNFCYEISAKFRNISSKISEILYPFYSKRPPPPSHKAVRGWGITGSFYPIAITGYDLFPNLGTDPNLKYQIWKIVQKLLF